VRPLVERMAGFGTTIFAEMSALAERTGAINLGQGFPDTDGPPEIVEAAVAAMRSGHNQYPPGPGIATLRHAIADHQRRRYGLEVDPDREVLVTAGATEAIAAAVVALAGPGDEVVTFEPYYDSYAATIAMGGATRRTVTLRGADFAFDPDELRAAVTPATRAIVLNTPHNPTGKVFGRAELAVVAELAQEHDLAVIADEVYEHLVYDGEHVPIATLPGMAERTLTISSAGKSFSFTGWKIGWVTGPEALVAGVRTIKQFLTYVSGAPFQHAVAAALAMGDEVTDELARSLRGKRDRIADGLTAAGFEVSVPAGTYFICADVRPVTTALGLPADGLALCRRLPELAGVVAIPTQVFYDDPADGSHLVRFAFCKRDDVIDEACRRLEKMEVPG